jgi:hypothetical protein
MAAKERPRATGRYCGKGCLNVMVSLYKAEVAEIDYIMPIMWSVQGGLMERWMYVHSRIQVTKLRSGIYDNRVLFPQG